MTIFVVTYTTEGKRLKTFRVPSGRYELAWRTAEAVSQPGKIALVDNYQGTHATYFNGVRIGQI
jgi:hypothetical protein